MFSSTNFRTLNDESLKLARDSGQSEFVSSLYNATLVRMSELVLFKLDDALGEAYKAREGLAAFLLFVKESMVEPDSPQFQTLKPDHQMRRQLLHMLDPKKARPSALGPQGRAEAVSCSYLFAYLQVFSIHSFTPVSELSLTVLFLGQGVARIRRLNLRELDGCGL